MFILFLYTIRLQLLSEECQIINLINHVGKGNITKSAEFNFMMDPEAAHIVMEKVKVPMMILPWETCIDGDFGITLVSISF